MSNRDYISVAAENMSKAGSAMSRTNTDVDTVVEHKTETVVGKTSLLRTVLYLLLSNTYKTIYFINNYDYKN